MNNFVIFAYRKRDDIDILLSSFPDTMIFVDYDVDIDSPYIEEVDHNLFHTNDTIANGLRIIRNNYPDHSIILINEQTTVDEIKLLIDKIKEKNCIVLSDSRSNAPHSLAQIRGISLITHLMNLIHRTKTKNALCNVQAIPAKYLDYFDNIHGGSTAFFINEHFIIKNNQLKTDSVEINTNNSTDIPKSAFMFVKHCFVIAWVFIKFMLSSFSAFLVDYSLSLLAYNFYAKYIVDFFSHFTSNPLLLDIEIISSASARLVGAVYVYNINKNIVFADKFTQSNSNPILKYIALVIIIWTFNTIILKSVTGFLGVPFAIAKIVADTIMYFLSFKIQRDVVFSSN